MRRSSPTHRAPTSRRALGLAALSLTLAAGACTSSGGGTTTPTTAPGGGTTPVRAEQLTFVSKLRQLSTCDRLLAELKAEASARVTAYGFGYGGGDVVALENMAGAATRAPTAAGDASSTKQAASAPEFSGTNVQEKGVDEPDLVKTDGKRIVTVTGNAVHVVDASSGTPRELGSVTLPANAGQANELLWHGDRLLVFGTSMSIRPMPASASAANRGIAIDSMPAGDQSSTITAIDIGKDGTPAVVSTLAVEGSYVTARQVGSVARVVVQANPAPLGFVYPQSRSGEARALVANREVVANTTLDDWMPRYQLRDAKGDERASGVLAACDRVSVPTEFAGFGSVSVLTFDLTRPLGNGDAVTVMAGADTVYASDANLYVATHSYVDPSQQGDTVPALEARYATSVHAFSIAGSGPATYTASGSAPGSVLNQFALSELDGRLRIATTKGTPWGARQTSESVITALQRDGDTLKQVGQVGGLGKGERIYAVRYAGPIAYVVTFRQTDPFYTVDLSDPTAPKVVGELKIPGYSGYLHPISATQVIGVGQNATDQGRVTGTKVSLFDVSDLAKPREVQNWTLPQSNTQAEVDHKAFLWWDALDMLVLPITTYPTVSVPVSPTVGPNSSSSPAKVANVPQATAIVLKVTDGGISEIGRVTHSATATSQYEWSPMLRSLVAADRLWTLSATTLQANRLSDLGTVGALRLG